MALMLTDEEYHQLPSLLIDEGKHSRFKLMKSSQKYYLLKEFIRFNSSSDVLDQLSYLLDGKVIENSGYPLSSFKVSGKLLGYICAFYGNAYSFSKVIEDHLPFFSFDAKKKALLDTVKQLQEFHQNGFIFSDIRLSNHLMDKDGGHLVDFEDSLRKGEEQVKNLTYYFYHQEEKTLKKNLSSQNEDRRRQALVGSSLLLDTNLEYQMYALKDNSLLLSEYFSMDESLEKMMQEVFFSSNVPYFDAYLEVFKDPLKNQYNGRKINRKIEKQLIKWYR